MQTTLSGFKNSENFRLIDAELWSEKVTQIMTSSSKSWQGILHLCETLVAFHMIKTTLNKQIKFKIWIKIESSG